MRHHPDKNPTSRAAAEALFKIIGEVRSTGLDRISVSISISNRIWINAECGAAFTRTR